MKYQSVKGMKDLLPGESAVWGEIERRIREVLTRHGFDEIRTPLLEQVELFKKGTGETSGIVVGKEMYTLTDKGDNVLALKPEMTPAVVRAYLQHNLGSEAQVCKLFYISPMFRQERPQAGRLRQFHQFGVEIFGANGAEADIESLLSAIEVYRVFGLTEFLVRVSSVGCLNCRPSYQESLTSYLDEPKIKGGLSGHAVSLTFTNPMRTFDSKSQQDQLLLQNAPKIKDRLCDECSTHLHTFTGYLRERNINFEEDWTLVRGLDYYTRTVFEISSSDLGSQDALGGGGRYDMLVEQMGGPATPAVGFAAGIERLWMVLEKQGKLPQAAHHPKIYLVAADDPSREKVFSLAMDYRAMGIAAEYDALHRSVKAQMRDANRRKAEHTVVLGGDELTSGTAKLKNMADGVEKEVAIEKLAAVLLQSALI